MLGDTIAALITAPGIGAMGALRLSGELAFEAASRVFRGKKGTGLKDYADYSLHYGGVYGDGVFLDQALLLKMKGPHSFTGEDVAELQCHGGPFVLNRLLAHVTSLPGLPVRPAEPGEFSRRAFLNGKMDLSQAEAVMELVSADNPGAALLAAGQLEGSLSRRLGRLGESILDLLAEIEAEVDFPEEDLAEPGGAEPRILRFRELAAEAAEALAAADRGRITREGIRVVLYGLPNAGKSSLLNGILGEERAIVTPEPGTTRDTLEEKILLRGLPIVLTDTAGIRAAGSEAERAGVDRARQAAARADLILYVADAQLGLGPEDEALLRELDTEKTLIVLNKTDLETGNGDKDLPPYASGGNVCRLSAFDPEAAGHLAERIKAFFARGDRYGRDEAFILNRRQHGALLRAAQALESACGALAAGMPEDVAAIDLKLAWSCLGELNGESLQPALVEKIFSAFCLGK